MPRNKSVPSRRIVLPISSVQDQEENTNVKLYDKPRNVGEVEQEPSSPRPAKRRRVPVDTSATCISVPLVATNELFGFWQLSDVVAIDDDSPEYDSASVRISCNINTGDDVLVSFGVHLGVGRSLQVLLGAPSSNTASNLIRLLKDGVLAVASTATGCCCLKQPCGGPPPVTYIYKPGALPSHCHCHCHCQLARAEVGPEAPSQCSCGLVHQRIDLGDLGSATDIAGGESEDWLAAVYVGATGVEHRSSPPYVPARDMGAAGSAVWAAAEGGAGPSVPKGGGGECRPHIRLGVSSAALERLVASDPEDVQQRAWQGQLLDVLGWLLPHISERGSAEQLEATPLPMPQQQQSLVSGLDGVESEALLRPGPPSGLHGSASGPSSQGPPASPKDRGTVGGELPTSPPGATSGVTGAAGSTTGFDPTWLFGAVKPSGGEPQWQGDTRELRPRLRPYQRRAVAWMLRREMAGSGGGEGSGDGGHDQRQQRGNTAAQATGGGAEAAALHPLWRRLHTLPGSAADALYVNAYTGGLALEPFPAAGPVRGGILADEMGLGKTVELLALITAHRFTGAGGDAAQQHQQQPTLESGTKAAGRNSKAVSRSAAGPSRLPERVDCPCGVRAADPNDPLLEEYTGLWILCDSCNAWMHGSCVGVKRSPRSAWVCTRCLRARALATVVEPCGATLIVVPSAILQQWYDEIRRHVHPGALRVVVYGGQTQPGVSGAGLICGSFEGSGGGGRRNGAAREAGRHYSDGADVAESLVVSAAQLASADVVLTTYDVLKRDVARQPDLQVQERSLRHGKRYEVVPTPLTRLRWWRVVLDEAQMVESSTAKAAEMALKLDTVHRWCVTGTPISRGLEDVYGLMAFLGARPWSERRWWNRCVQRPVEAGDREGRRLLLRLLRPTADAGPGSGRCGGGGGGLMWRSAKRDVEGELGLPAQSTHISHLRLNAVELHFYNRQHQDCASKARAVLPPRVVAAMESGRLLGARAEEQGPGQGPEEDMDLEVGQPEDGPLGDEGEGPRAEVATATAATDTGDGTATVLPGGGRCQETFGAIAAGTAAGAGVVASEPAPVPGSGLDSHHHQHQHTRHHEHREGQCAQGQADTSPPVSNPDPDPDPDPDPLLELHQIQRRRWEQWRQQVDQQAAEAAAAAAGEAMLVDSGVGPEAAAAGDARDSEETVADEANAGAGSRGCGAGGGGGGRRGSPPRLEGPRAALAAAAASLDRPLAPHEARKLLGPLLKLRQACCHPQVGVGGIRALTVTGQGPHRPPGAHHPGGGGGGTAPMTMAEILAVLVTRAKVEAEEAQRQLIAAFNGLSALMIIQGDTVEAIGTYRRALRVMEDNKPDINTDPLQRLHTLHNLAQMLAAAAAPSAPPALAAIPRTLRDHTLMEDAAAICSRYLEQRRQKLAVEEADYKELVSAASPFGGAAGWYLAAIDLLSAEGLGPSAADYIREKLLQDDTYRQKTEVNASSLAYRFSSLFGLKMLLNDSLDAVEEHRREAMRSLEDLGARTRAAQPAPEFVEQAGQCGRCRQGPVRALICEHCRLDEKFIQWEVRLFALYSRALTAGAMVTAEEAARRAQAALVRWAGRGGLHEEQGAAEQPEEGDDEYGNRRGANVAVAATSWRQSEAEMVLRLLLAQLRQHFRHRADERVEEILNEGKAHVDRLEAQRRLLVAARSTSLAQRMLLYAHDELGMATARMRLAREGEPIGPHEGNLKLHPAAVPVKNVELTNDRIVAEGDLRRTLGTLRYLRKLQSIQNQQQERRQQQHASEEVGPSGADTAAADAAASRDGSPPDPSSAARAAAEDIHAADSAAGMPRPGRVPTAGCGPTEGIAGFNGDAGTDAAATGQTSPAMVPGGCAAAAGSDAAPGVGVGSVGVGVGEGVELEVCPICHDPLDCTADSVILPCGHQMHPPCNDALVAKTVAPSTPYHQKRITCPTCRTRVHIADIAYIDAGLTPRSDGASGSGGAAADSGSGASAGPWSGEAEVMVRGSFGTKIEAVVRRIKFVLGQDATAKVLVFSGWVDLLELVAAALAANALPYTMARGRGGMAAALAAFKDHPIDLEALNEDEGGGGPSSPSGRAGGDALAESSEVQVALGEGRQRGAPGQPGTSTGQTDLLLTDGGRGGGSGTGAAEAVSGVTGAPAAQPGGSSTLTQAQTRGSVARRALASPAKHVREKPRVLLLQLKQGGAGLNLTEAQHVVLVEPQLDPAGEAQAVGRVHRIGQSRPTHVHRFVVTHTVEEQVFKLASDRARHMDMSSVAPPRGGHHSRGGLHGAGGGDGSEQLTVRDVAMLLDTRWGGGCGGGAVAGAATATASQLVASVAAAGSSAAMTSATGTGQTRVYGS